MVGGTAPDNSGGTPPQIRDESQEWDRHKPYSKKFRGNYRPLHSRNKKVLQAKSFTFEIHRGGLLNHANSCKMTPWSFSQAPSDQGYARFAAILNLLQAEVRGR
jgi:hypothetical protein